MCMKRWSVVIFFLLLCPLAEARLLYESNVLALHNVVAEKGSVNQHPVDVSVEQLEVLLGSIQVKSEATTDKYMLLFPESTALAAATELHTALRHLNSGRELLMVGFRKDGSFLRSKRFATSARVFVKNNQLNLIVGQIDRFYSEFRDKKSNMIPIGSRHSAIDHGAGEVKGGSGVESGRQDWLLFDLNAALAPRHSRRLGYGDSRTSSVSKKEMPQIVEPENTLESQFELLDRLYQKKLITAQEYEQKKKELLSRL